MLGTGIGVPAKIFANDDFAKMGLDTNDEWIKTRTGISQRRIAGKNESTSDLAVKAAEKAIENAGIDKEDIDLIVVATSTPDYPVFPSTACLVQAELGLEEIPAFDISAACTGFIYAMETAVSMMKVNDYKKVLVIGADALSKYCDWEDRSIVVLFGDGAGSVVLGDVDEGYGLLSTYLGARGQGADKLIVPIGGTKTPLSENNIDSKDRFIKMDGRGVYKFAVNVIVDTIEAALKKISLKKEDISFFIPHQANKRIIDYAAEKLGLNESQVYVNIGEYGNTSAASIPIALNEAFEKGLIKKGDIIVTVGFGAGLTYGANVIKWAK